MKALTSPEVAELHAIALRDGRLNPGDRVILAEIARTGHIARGEHLAKVANQPNLWARIPRKRRAERFTPAAVTASVAKLRELNYLPAAPAATA